MRKQIQKFICKLLEEELITVLAVSFVLLGIVWAKANTLSVDVSVTIYPAGGMITVTAPDGGESWTVGTSQNITWETVGEVDNVKIELQRSVGGSWEEIVASTTNDGSHPWTVTSPATTSAKIKITEVGDDTVTDQSDEVFSIVAAGGGGGYSPGGGVPTAPMIDLVTPREFSNNSAVTLIIKGSYLESEAKVYLGSKELSVPMNLGYELRAIVSVGFVAGRYQLKVVNPTGATGTYGTLITVTDDQYEAVIVDQSLLLLNLLPGEKVEVWVKVKNTSNYTWVRDGINQVQLGVPGDKKSLFYDPATWLIPHRAARMGESSVAYGQVATFRFYIKAPLEVGDYTDTFQLLTENVKWLSHPTITWQVKVRTTVTPPTTGGEGKEYAARLVKQSHNPQVELKPGEEVTLWVDFENIGRTTWTAKGDGSLKTTGSTKVKSADGDAVHLGTDRPRDRLSVFRNGNWPLRNRPTAVESATPPGAVGRFSFIIKAPKKTGQYREYFDLVAEHKAWMDGGKVHWDIVVTGPAVSKSIAKSAPSTGGVAVKYAPAIQLVFTDSFEKFFSQISKVFGGLWQGVRGWLPSR